MSKMTKKQQQEDFERLQGGKPPEGAVRRFADVQKKLAAKLKEKSTIRRQAETFSNQIQKASGNIVDPGRTKQAEDGLRAITDRLAKQKLTLPALPKVPDGVIFGTYTLKFTPPYAALGVSTISGSTGVYQGNPVLSTSVIPNIGQQNVSAVSDTSKPSDGWANSVIGIYFKPMFSQATARITVNFEKTFSWWVNSIGKPAMSVAEAYVRVDQYDGSFLPLVEKDFVNWFEYTTHELRFDFGSTSGSAIVDLPVATPHFYFVEIWLVVQAMAKGWPGSLAGANLSVRVPSITVDVTATPIIVNA